MLLRDFVHHDGAFCSFRLEDVQRILSQERRKLRTGFGYPVIQAPGFGAQGFKGVDFTGAESLRELRESLDRVVAGGPQLCDGP
jgi:hypothetical protein